MAQSKNGHEAGDVSSGDGESATQSSFRRAVAWTTLWSAWERVRANNGAAGSDGVTIGRFEVHAATRLSQLSHRLVNFAYEPAPVRRVLVPKPSGGLRPLDIPCVVDRVAQTAVAMVLGPVLEPTFEDSSFGYRPGRSVADAVARVAKHRRDGFEHVVDGDITRFFERVPHEPLLGRLDVLVDDPALVDLIGLWLEAAAPSGIGLAQGSPLSPLLANLHLDAVDEAIAAEGLRLVRYADDFVVLARTRARAAQALEEVAAILAAHGLELNREKSRLVSFDQGFRFLGHLFVRAMVMKEVAIDDTPPEGLVSAAAAIAAADEPRPEVEDEIRHGPRGRWAARRRVLHLVEPGRRLAALGELFVVTDPGVSDEPILRLAHGRVDRIEVGPEIAIDVSALDLAAASDTEIDRIDGSGMLLGRWGGPEPARAARHLAQARTILDPVKRARLASSLVMGRIANQRTLLKRLARGKPEVAIDATVVTLGREVRRLRAGCASVEEAMGREGAAAALYWPALAALLGDRAVFSGRRRRRIGFDPFNIAVDALSHLLAREIRRAVLAAALHPGFGALHVPEDDEDALVYDLMEEFRAPLVESLAYGLFARGGLAAADFVERREGGLRLARSGWSAIVRSFEGHLTRAIRDPSDGTMLLWRGLVDAQAGRLAAVFEDGGDYRPYAMDY